jgi:hypothetical protein
VCALVGAERSVDGREMIGGGHRAQIQHPLQTGCAAGPAPAHRSRHDSMT